MTMTDIPIDPPKPVKKKRAKKRRAAKPRAPALPKVADEFVGLSVTDCCKACSAAGCVISGSIFCGHPRKGGLQGGDMHNSEALERYRRAQKAMARSDAEKRFS